MSKLDDLMTIEAAARKVRMSRKRARDLSIAAGIAIRWGGPDEHPWLKVRLSELERVILEQRYVLPAAPDRQARRRPTRSLTAALGLNRHVKC
jgi:hypothetical protein